MLLLIQIFEDKSLNEQILLTSFSHHFTLPNKKGILGLSNGVIYLPPSGLSKVILPKLTIFFEIHQNTNIDNWRSIRWL
jgi:hypothetical protein